MWSNISQHPVFRAMAIYVSLVMLSIVLALIFKPVLLPLAIAWILYMFLHPLVVTLESRGIKDNLAISLVLVLLIIITIGGFIVLIPLLIDQLQELQTRLPALWDKTIQFTNSFTLSLQQTMGFQFDSHSLLERSLQGLKDSGANIVISSAGTMMQLLMAFFLVPLITYFLLRDYHQMRNHIMSWLPNRGFELGWLIYHAVARQLQGYMRGVMMQSGIIALVASIGFYLLNVDTAFLFGVMTGLLNLIPYIGPPLSIIPPLLVTLGSGTTDLYVLLGIPAVVLGVQLLDNLVIVPTLIANTVNLHPLIVLLGIIIFGALFGFIGMLIAIPVMAITKIVFTSLVVGLHDEGIRNY